MTKYNKLWAALAALVAYGVAQVFGLDLGEVGVGIDGDSVLQALISAVAVYFAPANQSPDDASE